MIFGGGSVGGSMIGTGIVFSLKDQFSATADKIKGKWKELDGVTEMATLKMERSLNRMKMGFAGLMISAAILAPFALGVKTALQLEDKLADVRKTTGMTADEAERLKDNLFAMDTRSSIESLLDIATIGGQVGVTTDKIEDFTKSVDKVTVALGDEFTGGAEEVSKVMGTLRNIFTDIKTDAIDKDILHISNAINELGASGFATGPVVSDFANRIGGVGIPLGLTTGQVLGLSATLQELGVNAERGGTAVSRTLQKMLTHTEDFAKIADMKLGDFENLLNTDIYGAFMKVVEGSKNMGGNAVDLAGILDDLGLDGAGTSEVFLKLGSRMDMLKEKTDLATHALTGTNSIMAEFNTKNNTSQALVDKFKTKITQLKDTMGKALLPALKIVVGFLGQMLDGLIKILKTPIGKFLMAAALATAILTAALSTYVIVSNGAKAITSKLAIQFAAMGNAQVATAFANKGMVGGIQALTKSLMTGNPYLIAAAIAVALLMGAFAVGKKGVKEFKEIMDGTREPVDGLRGALQQLGGVIYAAQEIWKSATGEGFSMSKKTAEALQKLGIYEFVIALGTWLVRLKAFFGGVWEGIQEVYVGVKDAVIWMYEGINRLANAFGFDLSKNLSDMKTWIKVGKILGYIIGGVIVVAMAIWVLQMLITAAVLFLMILPLLILIGIFYLIYRAIKYVWDNFKILQVIVGLVRLQFEMFREVAIMVWDALVRLAEWIYDGLAPAFEFIWGLMTQYYEFMSGLASSMWNIGSDIVSNLWEGMKSMWAGFVSWLFKAIEDTPLIGDAIEFLYNKGGGEPGTGSGTGMVTTGSTNTDPGAGGLMGTVGNMNAERNSGGRAGNTIVKEKIIKEETIKSIKIGEHELFQLIDQKNENDSNRK